jgi:PAS domain S-box-containing protein
MSTQPYDLGQVALILRSHAALCGSHEPLAPGRELAAQARWLYEEAPFCLLAHDAGPDPRFIYANRAAQRCFEYEWSELVGMPSRLSARTPERDERERFLREVAAHGCLRGYRGLRVARSGRRFWIEDGTLWNLIDDQGVRRGQAAAFQRISEASEPEPVAP